MLTGIQAPRQQLYSRRTRCDLTGIEDHKSAAYSVKCKSLARGTQCQVSATAEGSGSGVGVYDLCVCVLVHV